MNLRDVIERKIRKAQEEGKFRNLQNEGAALDLSENPFEDPEMRVAYKVLSNAGYCPPWIDLMKEIDADMAEAARARDQYRAQRERQMRNVHRGSVARFAELIAEIDAGRDRALARQEKRWAEINKQINHLNATVPIEGLRRIPIRIDRERERFGRDFPLLRGITSGRPQDSA